jgi:hypothetical protein
VSDLNPRSHLTVAYRNEAPTNFTRILFDTHDFTRVKSKFESRPWLHMRLMTGLRGRAAAWWALTGLGMTTSPSWA